MPTVRLTPLAESDLEEIWLHIAGDSPARADRLIDRLGERFLIIADNPALGPARSDIAEGLRYYPVGNYLVFYREIENGVLVLRVLHGARDYGGLL